MLIEGPLKITVAPPAGGQGRILVIGFTPEFQSLDLAAQGARFGEYLRTLSEGIATLRPDDPNYQGMLIVQQICEQLHPHIVSGDLVIEEPITIQIEQQQAVAITDLLGMELK